MREPGSRFMAAALAVVLLELVIWNFYPDFFRAVVEKASALVHDAKTFKVNQSKDNWQGLLGNQGNSSAANTELIRWFVSREELVVGKTAGLRLVGSNTDGVHTAVRMEHWATKQPVVIVSIHSRQTLELQMPFGEYRMVFSQNTDGWMGSAFGRQTRESVNSLIFSRNDRSVVGHEIRFDAMAGNMPTRPSAAKVLAQ